MKPGMHMLGLPFCHWPTGLTGLNMAFGGMSTFAALGGLYADAEGNGNLSQAPSVGPVRSESPVSSDKPPAAESPALEMAKNQDLPSPQCIPEGRTDTNCYLSCSDLHAENLTRTALEK